MTNLVLAVSNMDNGTLNIYLLFIAPGDLLMERSGPCEAPQTLDQI
jgi:hypothetical protein